MLASDWSALLNVQFYPILMIVFITLFLSKITRKRLYTVSQKHAATATFSTIIWTRIGQLQ